MKRGIMSLREGAMLEHVSYMRPENTPTQRALGRVQRTVSCRSDEDHCRESDIVKYGAKLNSGRPLELSNNRKYYFKSSIPQYKLE